MKRLTIDSPRARTACIAAIFAALALPGCYSRVINAKGIGADQQHPRQSEATQPVRARDFWGGSDEKENN